MGNDNPTDLQQLQAVFSEEDQREARGRAEDAARRHLANPASAPSVDDDPVRQGNARTHSEYGAQPYAGEPRFDRHPMHRDTSVEKGSPLGRILAERGQITQDQAISVINKLFNDFPEIRKYVDWAKSFAERHPVEPHLQAFDPLRAGRFREVTTSTIDDVLKVEAAVASGSPDPHLGPLCSHGRYKSRCKDHGALPLNATANEPVVIKHVATEHHGVDAWREMAFDFLGNADVLEWARNNRPLSAKEIPRHIRSHAKISFYRAAYRRHSWTDTLMLDVHKEDAARIRAWYQVCQQTPDYARVTPEMREKDEELIERLDAAVRGWLVMKPEPYKLDGEVVQLDIIACHTPDSPPVQKGWMLRVVTTRDGEQTKGPTNEDMLGMFASMNAVVEQISLLQPKEVNRG